MASRKLSRQHSLEAGSSVDDGDDGEYEEDDDLMYESDSGGLSRGTSTAGTHAAFLSHHVHVAIAQRG